MEVIFKLFPILDQMIAFYHQPRGMERFSDYLKILQGDSKNDMEVPIPHFNPMGKAHVLDKLLELKALELEAIMEEVIHEINKSLATNPPTEIKVVLSLADDLKGAWTNRYTTDYDSKFKLNGFVNRNFCTPLFWTSESFNVDVIKKRIETYCFRTLYWKAGHQPETLEAHLQQEIFVNQNCTVKSTTIEWKDFHFIDEYYKQHKDSTDHSRIFNFLYGDEFCREIGYTEFGIKEQMAGYKYARMKCL